MHLFERDCSVQSRHQKVVEIALAVALAEDIRAQMHADAVKLVPPLHTVRAPLNSWCPQSAGPTLLECNPRIQVEHTITEQVLGVDLSKPSCVSLVGRRSRIWTAVKPTLASRAVSQSRVVRSGHHHGLQGAGRTRVRIDGHGYAGYAPPAQYDPPGQGCRNRVRWVRWRLRWRARSRHWPFHIQGVDTNLSQLRAIVTDPSVASGDALLR